MLKIITDKVGDKLMLSFKLEGAVTDSAILH